MYQPGRRSRGRPRANLPFTNPSGRSKKPAGAHRRWRSRRCARPDATPPITRRNAFSCKQLAEKLRVSPDCLVLETVTRIIESWVTPFSHPLRGHRVASTVSRLSDRGPLFGHSSSPFPRSIWPRLAAKLAAVTPNTRVMLSPIPIIHRHTRGWGSLIRSSITAFAVLLALDEAYDEFLDTPPNCSR